LRVGWTVENGTLDFTWVESGIAIVAQAPLPIGFGRQYIERALPYQLGGDSSFKISPGELRCRIRLPLDERPRRAEECVRDRDPDATQ
jgi:hypothetical protein